MAKVFIDPVDKLRLKPKSNFVVGGEMKYLAIAHGIPQSSDASTLEVGVVTGFRGNRTILRPVLRVSS